MEWTSADFEGEEEEEDRGVKRKAVDDLLRSVKEPRVTLAKLSKKVSRIQREAEVKFKDAYFDSAVSNLAPITFPFNTLSQGDTPSQRTGDKVTMIGFQVRLAYYTHVLTNFGPLIGSAYRIMIVQDRMNNLGTTLTAISAIDDKAVLYDPSSGGDGTIIPYNAYQRQRYNILYDKVWDLNSPTLSQWSNLSPGLGSSNTAENPYPNRRTHTIHVRRRIVAQYKGTGSGSVGDIQTNAIWLVIYNSVGSSTPNHVHAHVRVYFMDEN